MRRLPGFILLLATLGCNKAFLDLRSLTYYFELDGAISSYTRRQFLNDSVFTETLLNIYKKELQCCDTFKVVGEKMFYMCDGSYYPYFSKEAYERGDTFCLYFMLGPNSNPRYHCNKYVPYNKKEFHGKTTYGFSQLWSKDGERENEQYIVYYLPGFGIVQFQDHRSAFSTIRVSD